MVPLHTMRPLEGFVIGVTADRRWQEQAELLERRGASVLHGPSITTLYLDCDEELRSKTKEVIADPPDYLVATTGIGMRAWIETAAVWGLGDDLAAALANSQIVARGPKSAGAVQGAGLTVWARSATERMDDVIAILLGEPLAGKRVVIQQYGMETPEVVAVLAGAGASVVEVPVYRWRLPDDKGPALRLIEAACEGRVDAVTFTSAPAVHNLFAIAADQQVDGELRRALNGRVVAACVGPVCAEGAREQGVSAPLAPDVGRLGLLVRALSDQLESRRLELRLEGCELVVQGSAILVNGQRADFTPRERAVFELLASTPGVVITRKALLERVWGSTSVDPHLLEVTMGRLRRRLGPCGAGIQAVSGRGYRLIPDAERIEPAEGAAAIVLAGGMARRMGGSDKLSLTVAGRSVLDRVLAAAAAVSRPVVAVGPDRPTVVPEILFVREEPPGGGPVPAVRAGLALLDRPAVVLVLAGDLPLLTAGALRRLLHPLEGDPGLDAVAAADHRGRANPLLAAYRCDALRRQAEALGSGVPAGRLLPLAVGVVDLGQQATLNVNSPEDLERANRLVDRG